MAKTKKNKKVTTGGAHTTAVAVNPFTLHHNRRCKFPVLGQRVRGQSGQPALSKLRANENREKTLLVEYLNRHKSNVFVDRRIGENNPDISEAKRRDLRRIVHVKRGLSNKRSLYNLNEGDGGGNSLVLTHKGVPLTDANMNLRPGSDDEDDLEEDGMLDAKFVKDQHFGGGDDDDGGDVYLPGESPALPSHNRDESVAARYKSQKDRMEEIIAESKKRKMQAREDKELQMGRVQKLDEGFTHFMDLMRKNLMTDDDKEEAKRRDPMKDYDRLVRVIKTDSLGGGRATPGCRLKPPEEVARDEQERLAALERQRISRMRGDFVDAAQAIKTAATRSADTLDDGLVQEYEARNPIHYRQGRLAEGSAAAAGHEKLTPKQALEEKRRKFKEEKANRKKMREEKEALANNDGHLKVLNLINKSHEVPQEMLLNSRESGKNIEASDEEADDNNDEEEEVAGKEESENEEDEEEEEESDEEDNYSDILDEEEEMDESDENEDNREKGAQGEKEEDKEISSTERSKIKKKKENDDQINKKKRVSFDINDLNVDTTEDEKQMMKEAKEELPYTFEVPKDYDGFWSLVQQRSPAQVGTLIARMISSNHPSLHHYNKVKCATIFSYIMQTIHVLCAPHSEEGGGLGGSDGPPALAYLDPLMPPLYTILKLCPEDAAKATLAVFIEKRDEYRNKVKKRFPTLDTLVFLRVAGLLFPASDFFQHVMTPVKAFLVQLLGEAKMKQPRDVIAALLVAQLLAEYTRESGRFIPELSTRLLGLLLRSVPDAAVAAAARSAVPLAWLQSSTLPPHHMMLLTGTVGRAPARLKLCMVNDEALEMTDELRCSVVLTTLRLLRDVCMQWSALPSIRTVLSPLSILLPLLPRGFPSQVTNMCKQLQQAFSELPPHPTKLTVDKGRPKPLRMLEPLIREVHPTKSRAAFSAPEHKAVRQKLITHVKRERKAAKRELQKNNMFLSRQKLKETLASDAERKRKVNLIMNELGHQESEYHKYKNS